MDPPTGRTYDSLSLHLFFLDVVKPYWKAVHPEKKVLEYISLQTDSRDFELYPYPRLKGHTSKFRDFKNPWNIQCFLMVTHAPVIQQWYQPIEFNICFDWILLALNPASYRQATVWMPRNISRIALAALTSRLNNVLQVGHCNTVTRVACPTCFS